jgi:hypothetical protein
MTDNKPSNPRHVLAALAAANPGVCRCGHTSAVHGFGSGECWTCAWDDQRPDCDAFEADR